MPSRFPPPPAPPVSPLFPPPPPPEPYSTGAVLDPYVAPVFAVPLLRPPAPPCPAPVRPFAPYPLVDCVQTPDVVSGPYPLADCAPPSHPFPLALIDEVASKFKLDKSVQFILLIISVFTSTTAIALSID